MFLAQHLASCDNEVADFKVSFRRERAKIAQNGLKKDSFPLYGHPE